MKRRRQVNPRNFSPSRKNQDWRQGINVRDGPYRPKCEKTSNNRCPKAISNQSYQRNRFDHNSAGRYQRDDDTTFHQRRGSKRAAPNDNSGNSKRQRFMGFKFLENLLQKDSEQLVLELSSDKIRITEFIHSNLTPDAIILLVNILKKVTDSPFNDTKHQVLQIYLDDSFVEQLIKYVLFLPMQNEDYQKRNSFFWNDPDEFWRNVVRICQDIYDSLPTFSRKVVPEVLKSMIVCFPSFESQHNCHISEEIKDIVNKLNSVVQASINDFEKDQVDSTKISKESEPYDDFRQISIYPTSFELISEKRSFLRKNVVEGPYRDVNHYLDVQFRLLREDFVEPLRSGIANYRSVDDSKKKKRIENVKIHKKVVFVEPVTTHEQYCVRLQFNFSRRYNFVDEHSKRFMYGSLLCFTCDDFKTIIFGRVAERKKEDLEKGEIVVGFDENVDIQYETDYLMVECSVYFEPYYHVLNVLKRMRTDNFPMEKYIIKVDPSVQLPEYLKNPDCTYEIEKTEFSPLANWPAKNFYGFNESQNKAFRAALTQEFCIIQGPPGTGKTFLGLKIAKTLIENQKVWYNKTPMLVICYTNHALDQFLEGLTQFTEEIVRVGGQSKNENLQSFNLRNRSRFKFSPAVLNKRREVQMILQQIKSINENLKQMEMWQSVRDFQVFEDVVPDFKWSWFYHQKEENILDWLLERRQHLVTPTANDGPKVKRLINKAEVEEGELLESDCEEMTVLDEYNFDEDEELEDENEFDADQQIEIDDLFEEMNVMKVQCSKSLITLPSLQHSINELENSLCQMLRNENPTIDDFIKEETCNFELLNQKDRYNYLKQKLREGKQRRTKSELPESTDLRNPHSMSSNDRWNLYFHWLDLYKQKLKEKFNLLNKQFRKEYKIYEEMRDIDNSNIMKNVLVVGMTTTGAARLRSSLQALKSPVVIVEEAAEVLEAHIITSLTKHCKHLILIGDHQQLKPSTASYSIERFYNLGISLFERMVINKIQLYTLNVQHRMKPEISNLIAPTIYPSLEDHPSVNQRPPIRGLDQSLFFIDHNHQEEKCAGTSKKNFHEVKFLIQLAKYLVLNGYQPENITILAAYLGQMFEMRKEKKRNDHVLKDVRIAVLDNYQGEESDIILLSLVRNNNENKIGFLSIENRVCVALSRARNGFYIMGNMDQLCAESELWQQIRDTLQKQNAIGTELVLRCQVHQDQVTLVKKSDDFLNIPEGGCNQKCGVGLACGHTCTSVCHASNREHLTYKCREKCNRKLCDTDPDHICKKMCYEDCGLCNYLVETSFPCGHTVNLKCHIDVDTYECVKKVFTKLPCGHEVDKPCRSNPETYRCPHPCKVKVEPCGHACKRKCHIRRDPDHLKYLCMKPCTRYMRDCTVKTEDHSCLKYCYEECDLCTIPVLKKRSTCAHFDKVPCSSEADNFPCDEQCKKILPCGHQCKKRCLETCEPCEIEVEKTVPECGHTIKVQCNQEPVKDLCKNKCPLKLSCGHPCTRRCNEPCTTTCREKVECSKESPCGHTVTKIRCSDAKSDDPKILLTYCTHPCSAQLKCEHSCSGTCGTCYQGRIHKGCTSKCGFPLVCNHPCTFPCRLACRPCVRSCQYECRHSICGKRCGDVCTPCREKCTRRCPHQVCKKLCGQICSVPPCDKPCQKKLKCGHPCVGFCGDLCPKKCLVCHKQELTKIFFGFEEDEGARFVVLRDCKHIFESKGLDQWMNQKEEKISFKLCPECKTPIKTAQRYSELIKKAMADVSNVKKSLNGTDIENSRKRTELLRKLVEMNERNRVFRNFPKLKEVLQTLEKRLHLDRRGKRQSINKPELSSIESKLQIIEHIIKICNMQNSTNENEIFNPQIKLVMDVLLREADSISGQEVEDIQYELNRLARMVDYSKIKNSIQFISNSSRNSEAITLKIDEIEKILFGFEKFHDEDEKKVKGFLEELDKLAPSGIRISENERREIVQAMGFKQGHWYKCPNGHPYVITECGGAMQESRCPECGARIGGTDHRLLRDNAVATEMDGSKHGAWSEAANMGNYEL